MFAKIAVLACILAVSNAGLIAQPAAVATYAAAPAYTTSYATPALTATSENVYRSAGNLHSISTQSKSITTPFSSSNKHFTSVTNPGVYAAPIAHATYAAPLTYSAPQAHYAYSAPVAHGAQYAYSTPVAHAAPAVSHGSSLLGVAYSPAVAVSHMSYSSPVGVNYAW